MLTNAILSEKLSVPLTKVRRWTKEFLPADPKVTRQSGYTREFSNNDGFKIFLGGYLVSSLGFSFEDARSMLEIIWHWAGRLGLSPDIWPWAERRGIDKQVCEYEIDLQLKLDPTHWLCKAKGFIRREEVTKIDSLMRTYGQVKQEAIVYTIGPAVRPLIDGREVDVVPPFHRVLPITFLLKIFNESVVENHDKWIRDWEKLAKKPE